MKRADRVNLLRDTATALTEREWAEIDLVLREFGRPTQDVWHGGRLNYVLAMLDGIDDGSLIELHEYLVGSRGPAATGNAGPWQEGYARVFMSHIHEHRAFVGDVKRALARLGIDCFVAHDDIEPSQEWMNEIKLALATCDALAAFLHPGFRQSQWCDQEVGYCLLRNVLIMPLMFEKPPHGFLSQWQGHKCRGQTPGEVADSIFSTCLGDERLRPRLEEALMRAFAASQSYMEAADLGGRLSLIREWTPERTALLHEAYAQNDQIHGSFKTRAIVTPLLRAHPLPPMSDDVPF
jgi:hypothetical protein